MRVWPLLILALLLSIVIGAAAGHDWQWIFLLPGDRVSQSPMVARRPLVASASVARP